MGLVDNFKDLFKVAEAVNNLDLYKKLTELQTRAMELEEENGRLRTENERLQQTLLLREKMTFKEPFYYQDGDNTPFCPSCFESNRHEAIHVVREWEDSAQLGWICPTCKNRYVVRRNALMKPWG